MKLINETFKDNYIDAEKSVLAYLVVHPEARAVIAAIVDDPAQFENPKHQRLYSALMSAPGGELAPLGVELYLLLLSRSDLEAADLLVELSTTPQPFCNTKLIQLAICVRDQARYREDIRLQEEARESWLQDPECSEPPDREDDGLEW